MNTNERIEETIKILKSKYFKISLNENNEYDIIEFNGLTKPSILMMREGWNKHQYLTDYINEDYPEFNLEDFKSVDGFKIEKKNKNDVVKDECKDCLNYFKGNTELANDIIAFKNVLSTIGIDFMNFETFNELTEHSYNFINGLQIQQSNKNSILFNYITSLNKLYIDFDKFNVDQPRLFLNNKFKIFFMLVN